MNFLDIRDNLPTPQEQIEKLKNILFTNYGNLYIFNWKTDIEGLLVNKSDTYKLAVYNFFNSNQTGENLSEITDSLLKRLINGVIKECNRQEVYRVNILPPSYNIVNSYLITNPLKGVIQFYFDEN